MLFSSLVLNYKTYSLCLQVGQQCKENIFAIQTLRDFQHNDEGKDHGLHVREKAKQLVSLLRDEERLRNERARALKAKERFAQTASGFGSDTTLVTHGLFYLDLTSFLILHSLCFVKSLLWAL